MWPCIAQTANRTLLYHNDNRRVLLDIRRHLSIENTVLTSLHAAQRPGVVRNLTRGPVSVSEDGSSVQLLQRISWQPPVSGEVMLYLIRYGMGVHNPEDASFNITTTNTSIVLTLSVPEGPPDKVVYNIWVAFVSKSHDVLNISHEHGNATVITIQYSSESGIVIIKLKVTVVQVFHPLLNMYWNPLLYTTLHLQDQVPPLVSLSKHSPVTHWMWRGLHLTTQEVCPLLDTTSHTLTHEPVTCYMDTLIPQWNPFSSSNQTPNTLWGWWPWMLLERGTLHRRTVGIQDKDVGILDT